VDRQVAREPDELPGQRAIKSDLGIVRVKATLEKKGPSDRLAKQAIEIVLNPRQPEAWGVDSDGDQALSLLCTSFPKSAVVEKFLADLVSAGKSDKDLARVARDLVPDTYASVTRAMLEAHQRAVASEGWKELRVWLGEHLVKTSARREYVTGMLTAARSDKAARDGIFKLLEGKALEEVAGDPGLRAGCLEFLSAQVEVSRGEALWNVASITARCLDLVREGQELNGWWACMGRASEAIKADASCHTLKGQRARILGALFRGLPAAPSNADVPQIATHIVTSFQKADGYDRDRVAVDNELRTIENLGGASETAATSELRSRLVALYRQEYPHLYGSHCCIEIVQRELNESTRFNNSATVGKLRQLARDGLIQPNDGVYLSAVRWYAPSAELFSDPLRDLRENTYDVLWACIRLQAMRWDTTDPEGALQIAQALRSGKAGAIFVPEKKGWNFVEFSPFDFEDPGLEIARRYIRSLPSKDNFSVVPMVLKDDYSQEYRSRQLFVRLRSSGVSSFPLKARDMAEVGSDAEAAQYKACALPLFTGTEDLLLEKVETKDEVRHEIRCRIEAPYQAYIIIPNRYWKK